MTMTAIRPDGLMSDLIDEAKRNEGHVRTLHHEDGSVTVVSYDQFGFEHDPRDYDGIVSALVSDSRDYLPIDDADEGIAGVRERAESLDWLTDTWELSVEEETTFLRIKDTNGYTTWLDLSDPDDVRLAAAYFKGYDEEQMVQAYIAEERPDIAYYHHEWSVQGVSQGDYREGWGYVSVRACEAAGVPLESAEEAFKVELETYRQWFAGETYMATHIMPAGEEYAIGDHGGYYTGEMMGAVDTCHGFLGYDDLKQISEQFTDSPVIREEW